MDVLLIVLAAVFIFAGIIGSIIPVIPGAPLSWCGLLILHFTSIPFNYTLLIITFILTAIIMLLQYIIPAYGTKKYGGSKWGMAGTFIGLFVGLVVPIPFGVLIGSFIGAFIGEMLYQSNSKTALRAAFGSFIGFLASTFIELVFTLIIFGIFIYKIWDFRDILF
ncbi:MAG TPA: DUF456 domain-containing protein [Salinimicrobium sp.]|nr:DUF456 domain-containing protein [Salinimicrobium sp.]